MLTNTHKEELLIKAFEFGISHFKEDKELLSKVIGSMSCFNLDLAVEMWERSMLELESETRGKNFKVKRKGDHYDEDEIGSENYGDDFNNYLCFKPAEILLEFTSSELLFNSVRKHPVLMDKLFSKDNIVSKYHKLLLLNLLSNNEFKTGQRLIFQFLKMGYLFDKLARGDDELRWSNMHLEGINYILRHMEVEAWEKGRKPIYEMINDLNLEDPYMLIQHGISKRMRERIDVAGCTLDFVKHVSLQDYDKADISFQQALDSVDFDFSLDYYFYRIIQNTKIDSWMKCDVYLYKMLKEYLTSDYSDKLMGAIEKKEKLKANRILKAKRG